MAPAIDSAYGTGQPIPAHVFLEDGRADFESGLLIRVQAALLLLTDGQVLRIASPVDSVAQGLRTFERATNHALLSVVPDEDRPGWRYHYVRKGGPRTDWAAGPARPQLDAGHAVDDAMPRRLWIYTNYDCNLQCDYCCVVSGPRADPRHMPAARARSLVDQGAIAGLERVFLTGGEPTLRRDLPELIEYITDRMPLTLLTNAMLLRGPRWDAIRPLIGQDREIAFQVSLDSADSELHDAHRGRGAHGRAIEGIRTLLAAGAHVRLAASLPEEHLDEIPRLHELADQLGIAPDDRIFRPIALRGAAEAGEAIRPEDVAPELTADALGWFWHPISNEPDMRLPVTADASLREALDAVRARLETIMATRAVQLDRFTCG